MSEFTFNGRTHTEIVGADGWILGSGTWSYTSADAPSFVASVPDASAANINVGDRIKLTQTTAKYFIVTAKGSPSGGFTPVTLYGGTDYTLANAAITSPYYSHAKSPLGFPLNPEKWSVSTTNNSLVTQASAVSGTWYNLGSISLSVPIGSWIGYYEVALQNRSTGAFGLAVTLSTANNSESDALRSQFQFCTVQFDLGAIHKRITLNLAAKTTHYLNAKTTDAGTPTIGFQGSAATTIVKFVCAYL